MPRNVYLSVIFMFKGLKVHWSASWSLFIFYREIIYESEADQRMGGR